MSQRKLGLFVSMVFGSVAMVACGGGGGNAASGFDSAEDLAEAMDSPTGTVDAATATPVAEEFAKVQSSGLGGIRQKVQEQSSGSIPCSGGGDISYEGNETRVDANYNACVEGDCTIDGQLRAFVSSATSTAVDACYTMNASITCGVESATVAGSFCMSVNGETGEYTIEYLIDVNGNTYVVSGYYSNGTGELTIRGANGTYTCTYTDGSGSCVDEGGAEFEF